MVSERISHIVQQIETLDEAQLKRLESLLGQFKAIPTLELVRSNRIAILQLAQRCHAEDVRVFGSVARGTASYDSDIDFLVSYTSAHLEDRLNFLEGLTSLLGYRVDIADEKYLHPAIKTAALLEAIPV
jgi:uncharacterized protein